MFVSPINERITRSDMSSGVVKKAWANYTLYDDGIFYMFFGTGIQCEENPSGYAIAIDVAMSKDGVHWQFISRNAVPIAGAHAGFGIKKIGDWFYYYPTCSDEEKGVHVKVYRTKNFIHFEHMGDEYDIVPDKQYYHARWDEVHIIKEQEQDGKTVYYGYISSEVKASVGEPGCGFMKSYDGIAWTVLPPIAIVWGDLPAQHMELNFVEKIGDYYFLSMSGRLYMDSYGYSLYTFKSDSPKGPFYPDVEKYRLCGNARRDITWLGHSIDYPGGMLAALWLSHDIPLEIPSTTFAIGDLKRIVYENGHIRFGYWEGTDNVKGAAIKLSLHDMPVVHPTEKTKTPKDCLDITPEGLSISASRDGIIVSLGEHFDLEKGFFVEGQFCVTENRSHMATHHHAASLGFYFGNGENHGTAIIADTLGVTRCGTLRYADCRITENNPHHYAGIHLTRWRSGDFQGTVDFDYDDTVSPLGHASTCGIRHNKTHTFKLLARCDYFVLYIDDCYVQTYLTPEHFTGQFSICCFDGNATVNALQAWEMNL